MQVMRIVSPSETVTGSGNCPNLGASLAPFGFTVTSTVWVVVPLALVAWTTYFPESSNVASVTSMK